MKKLLLLALGMCAMSTYAYEPYTVNTVDSTTTITNTTYYNTNYVNPYQDITFYHQDVFKSGYFRVSYVNEKLEPQVAGSILNVPANDDLKCDWGVALDWGGMINFTRRPIVDMVNIGLDMNLALAYANYKDGAKIGTEQKPAYEDLHHASVGLAVGPAVAVAPFAKFDNNILKHLVVKAFYHFTPSYTALMYKDGNDESATKGGFCLYQSLGFEVSYRRLGVGVESVQGKAKYKDIDFENMTAKGDKLEIKSPATRFFVSLKF